MVRKSPQKPKQEKNQEKKNVPPKKSEDESDHLHWSDKMALDIIERVKSNPVLKKIVDKHGVIVYDEKTPSGSIHVGSGRGWVMHDVIAKTLRNHGIKATFILSSDDSDPYDKPNKELGPEWNKYLGMPFRNIPSPKEGYEHFGDYYFMQCVEKFKELGIDADIESTGAEYEKGTFNTAIKKILDNHEKVQAIYKRLYGAEAGGANKIPFNLLCEKCGRIATTLAKQWDKKKELLTYECPPDNSVVKWANGCGHTGKISPYNGNGKFPWKVEWAAKWPSKNVICEFAGKDHFTLGGSRTCAVAISDEVLDYPPPYPSTRKETGKGYEFFNIGGKKMSTSKGQGIAFAEVTTILPPKIVRFLLVRSRPHAVIDFDPYRDNDVIFLFDRYDETERIYFGDKETTKDLAKKEIEKHKRIYELSQTTDEIPKKMPVQISFSFAAHVIQIGLNEEGALAILKKLGHIPAKVSGTDVHYVMERLHDAKRWVEKFASDEYKFQVQTLEHVDKVKKELSDKQRSALKLVAKKLKQKAWKPEDLHTEFYEICKSIDLDMKEFFNAAYKIMINKNRGPRLAAFLIALGDTAVEMLERV